MESQVASVIGQYNVITINSIPTEQAKPNLNYSNDISLGILMTPSDPDFPFDVPLLHVLLLVPQNYPKGYPQLLVLNDDIPRGYSYNIELGFKDLTGEKKDTGLELNVNKDRGLLGLLEALDKYLEAFLSLEKKEARVKIVKQKSNKKKLEEKEKEKDKPKKEKKKKENVNNDFKNEQIKVLKSRFPLKTVKEGSIYKLSLRLSEPFQFEFDSVNDLITVSTLHIKLVVPQDYGQPKGRNRVKIELDIGHPEVLKLINGVHDSEIKLVLRKLLTNISKNFDILTSKYRDWKLTEYLNFLVGNLSKLMGDQTDFQRFIEVLQC